MSARQQDPHPWRAVLWGALFTVVVGMTYTMVVMPAIKGWGHTWWVPGELWPPMMAARYVANGAFPYLYEADRLFVATPLGAVVLAPVAALGQALHLTDNQVWEVPQPTLWLAYGPYALGLCAVLLYAARRLAERTWPFPSGRVITGSGLLWTQIASFGLVIFPAGVVFGHFEDIWALAFVLLGIRDVIGERWTRAAMLFGVAIAFKQWALLGVPLVVALSPPGRRLHTLRASLVVPAVLVAVPLAADWSHASVALFRPESWTSLGHVPPWVHRSRTPVIATHLRAGAIVVAVGIAFLIRRRADPAVILAGFALAFLARLAFEEVTFAYYLCPGLALLFFHERIRGRSGVRTVLLGSGWLAFFLLFPNAVLWWAVSVGFAVAVAWRAAGEVWRAARSKRAPSASASAAPPNLAPLEPIPS